MITTRRIQPGEVELYRKLRLMALQDAPYAFSSTYQSALQRTAESWREQAESCARGTERAIFFAFSGQEPAGLAALYRSENQGDAGELLQVWVAPVYRGTGAAWDLMNAVFTWAGENNIWYISASVKKENSRAIQFYYKYGFSMMGLDPNSPQDSDELVLVKEVTL